MKWIELLFDNVWAVVIIAGVLMQLFEAITKRKGEAQIPPKGQPPKEYEFEDPELAARTRKIREEIQRKIAERQRGGEDSPAPATDVHASPPVIREVITAPSEPAATLRGTSRLEVQRQAEILEEQAAWEQKLAEAKGMKAAAQKRTEFEMATADYSAATRSMTRAEVLGELHSPEALRRAFILREVLGPPVALRR
jgi:hypothetical protein